MYNSDDLPFLYIKRGLKNAPRRMYCEQKDHFDRLPYLPTYSESVLNGKRRIKTYRGGSFSYRVASNQEWLERIFPPK